MKTLLPKLLFLCCAVAYPSAAKCQTASWKDINVMTSTRDDVRRILRQSDPGSIFEIYSIENGTIDVDYSYGKCTDEYNSGWNIPENIVIEFAYTPLTEITFSKLKVDLKKFEKVRESPHVPEMITYKNKNEGIRYVVDETSGLLQTIGFFPSASYDKLRCEPNQRGLS